MLRAEPSSGDLSCENVPSRPHVGSSASGTGAGHLVRSEPLPHPHLPVREQQGSLSLGLGQKVGEADDAFRVWAQDGRREQELGQAVWGLRQGM